MRIYGDPSPGSRDLDDDDWANAAVMTSALQTAVEAITKGTC
jgi:hypothetical protein